jgi:hypothetical protein
MLVTAEPEFAEVMRPKASMEIVGREYVPTVTPELFREIVGVVPPVLAIGADAETAVTGAVPLKTEVTIPFELIVTVEFV